MKKLKFLKIIFICLLVLLFGVLIVLKSSKENVYSTDIFDALNTHSKITLVGGKECEDILKMCADEVYKYDNLLSHTKEDSEIFKLNNNTTENISGEVIDIISKCREFYEKTDGRFDITIGALSDLWNDAIKMSEYPQKEEIYENKKLTDFNSLIIDKENFKIKKEIKNQKISLGAVAKGYICDVIKEKIEEYKLNGVMINLGGNVYAKGVKPDGDNFLVGIRDPKNEEDIIGSVIADDCFIITSGNYERFSDINGERIHHIIDAKTGYPAKTGLMSVTIISKEGFLADALSTSCFLLGFQKGKELLSEYQVSAIFVTEDNKVYYSKDLEEIFKKSNAQYSYFTF